MFERIPLLALPLILLVFLGTNQVEAQCPNVSIQLADSACEGDTIFPSILSPTNLAEFEWDYCSGDVLGEPTVTNFGNIQSALTYPRQITIVQDGGTWLGFISNISASTVYRLNFGSSLDNTPTLDTLNFTPSGSNPGNSFSKIRFRKEGVNWFGVQVTEQERMLIFNFGASLLNNNISATVLNNPLGLMDNARDIVLVEDNDSVFGFVINLATEDITVFRFGTSISAGPLSGYNESIIEDSNLLNNSSALEAIKYCDEWLVFVSSFATDNLVRVNLGNLSGSATAELLGTSGSVVNPQTIELVSDAGAWHLFIKTTQGGGMVRGDFGSDLTSTPSYTALGTYGSTINGGLSFSLDMVKQDSKWYCFVANAQNNNERIVRLAYPNSCVSNQLDSASNPSWVLSDTGLQYISFRGVDSSGNSWHGTDSIYVFASPLPDFSYSGVCDGDSTHFEDNSTSTDSITAWLWEFGDGATSTETSPSHLYTDTGTYTVTLTITSESGCSNSHVEDVVVYPLPNASFSPDTTCARSAVVLNETSSSINDSIVSWEWTFDADTSFGQFPSISFDSLGLQQINLTVITSNGCIDNSTEMVFVKETPSVLYDIGNTCNGDSTPFTNLSSIGTGSLDYFWDFGDGSFSTTSSPVHLYGTIGTYQSLLVGMASNGCYDSASLAVVISNPPQVSFFLTNEPACTDNQLQFIDSSTVVNGSIIQWDWTFSDGTISTVQNPFLTLANGGTYSAVLEAFSGTKCSTVDSIAFEVLQSPTIDYDISGYCEDQVVNFMDLTQISGSDSLVNWTWTINGSNYSQPNVTLPTPDSSHIDVEFAVTATSGCQVSSNATLEVFAPITVNIQPLAQVYCTDLNLDYQSLNILDVLDSLASQSWYFIQSGIPLDSGSGSNYTASSSSAGIFEVVTTLSSKAGCRAEDTVSLNIALSPNLSIQTNKTCLFDTTFFLDNYSGSNYAWDWNFGDGFTTSSDDPAHIYLDTGLYSSHLTLTDVTSGCFDTASAQTRVVPNPTILFYSDQLCTDSEVAFYDSSITAFDTINYWKWKSESGQISFAQNPLLSFEESGTTVLDIEVGTSNGCHSSQTEIVTVYESPEPTFSWSPVSAILPQSVQFESPQTWASIFWVAFESDTVEDVRPDILVSDSASFPMTLHVISEDGCKGSFTDEIEIKAPKIDLSISELNYSSSNGLTQLEMTVSNRGTVVIESPLVRAYVNDESSVLEPLGSPILPGESVQFNMGAVFETGSDRISRACAFLVFDESEFDVNLGNNSICISSSATDMAFNPYPNPAQRTIHIPYFLAQAAAEVIVNIYDESGKLVSHHPGLESSPGFHTATLSVPSLNGLNAVEVVLGSDSHVFQTLFVR